MMLYPARRLGERETRSIMNLQRILLIGILVSLGAAPAFAGYTSGGTFVVKVGGVTVVDNGGVVCDGLTGGGEGGGCLPIPPADNSSRGVFVGVTDDAVGARVAFQVCIDNNGDGICGGDPKTQGDCPDQIFFSHSDGGRFFNPLGPLPTTTLQGCADAFQGYIVLLCQGVHEDAQQGPHQHRVTTGSIFHAKDGNGYGDFCGGNGGGTATGIGNTAAKAYVVR